MENGETILVTGASRGAVHGYENTTDRRATSFCCDCPPFIPQDEIEV